MNKQISILGCGWLGLPLAKALIEKGFSIKGSTTSENKLSILEENTIEPFLINLLEDKIEGNIQGFLNKSEILIIDIPPGLRGEKKHLDSARCDKIKVFVEKMKTLATQIEKSEIKKVLFVSSTSVYSDVFPIEEFTEETPTNPDTESGKQLVEVEELLLGNPNFNTIILRFGGLIGEDRHPIKYLAGKENVDNPDGFINFIHQEDCIGIIKAIIEKGLRQAQYDSVNNEEILKRVQNDKGLRQAQSDNRVKNEILKQVQHENQIFNAVAPQHPTREEYYHKKARIMNLALPIFAKDTVSKGKIISSAKIEKLLGYTFKKEI
ncbi:MAG: SDR family NAD(P)-dependent oxidoreductase [Flavobacterium sp.]|nr:SDR family NAD(P)-dependent oxidoreductase [Flavobacterium sp.]